MTTTKHNETTGETHGHGSHEAYQRGTHETPVPTPQAERPDEPSAIPKDYVPQPYPGYRWNDATGESVVVNNLAEDEAKRAEGFTSRVPPTGEPAPKGSFPKTKRHKDGRTRTVANELDEDTAALEGFTLDEKDEKKKKAD